MKQYQLLQKAVGFFEREQVLYRIVGAMASIAYGEPRLTIDIDILVDLNEQVIDALELEFPAPEFYLSIAAALQAIRRGIQFNIIHLPTGMMLDIIPRRATEFGMADIAHGQRLKHEGFYDAWFASPEHVILMKLKYYQEGGAEKHLRDIASMLLIQGPKIDRDYIANWTGELNVAAEWQIVLDGIDRNTDYV